MTQTITTDTMTSTKYSRPAIIHVVNNANWYASQSYSQPRKECGIRCVEIRDKTTDELIQSIEPPQDWKEWIWNVTPDGSGIAIFLE